MHYLRVEVFEIKVLYNETEYYANLDHFQTNELLIKTRND